MTIMMMMVADDRTIGGGDGGQNFSSSIRRRRRGYKSCINGALYQVAFSLQLLVSQFQAATAITSAASPEALNPNETESIQNIAATINNSQPEATTTLRPPEVMMMINSGNLSSLLPPVVAAAVAAKSFGGGSGDDDLMAPSELLFAKQLLFGLATNDSGHRNGSSQIDGTIDHAPHQHPNQVGSHLLLLFALLVLINLIVILGNILVILAVYATVKLRNVTNIFIVSLATADLLLGVFVLPYALMFEILDVWIFGQIWCRGWLVTDVWISTASILNLCAISVDRYVAVTRPVKYRSIMTPRRAKTIVAGVWVVSFLICLPPLLQHWNPSVITTASHQASPIPLTTATTSPSTQMVLPQVTLALPLMGGQEDSRPAPDRWIKAIKRNRKRRRRRRFAGYDDNNLKSHIITTDWPADARKQFGPPGNLLDQRGFDKTTATSILVELNGTTSRERAKPEVVMNRPNYNSNNNNKNDDDYHRYMAKICSRSELKLGPIQLVKIIVGSWKQQADNGFSCCCPPGPSPSATATETGNYGSSGSSSGQTPERNYAVFGCCHELAAKDKVAPLAAATSAQNTATGHRSSREVDQRPPPWPTWPTAIPLSASPMFVDTDTNKTGGPYNAIVLLDVESWRRSCRVNGNGRQNDTVQNIPLACQILATATSKPRGNVFVGWPPKIDTNNQNQQWDNNGRITDDDVNGYASGGTRASKMGRAKRGGGNISLGPIRVIDKKLYELANDADDDNRANLAGLGGCCSCFRGVPVLLLLSSSVLPEGCISLKELGEQVDMLLSPAIEKSKVDGGGSEGNKNGKVSGSTPAFERDKPIISSEIDADLDLNNSIAGGIYKIVQLEGCQDLPMWLGHRASKVIGGGRVPLEGYNLFIVLNPATFSEHIVKLSPTTWPQPRGGAIKLGPRRNDGRQPFMKLSSSSSSCLKSRLCKLLMPPPPEQQDPTTGCLYLVVEFGGTEGSAALGGKKPPWVNGGTNQARWFGPIMEVLYGGGGGRQSLLSPAKLLLLLRNRKQLAEREAHRANASVFNFMHQMRWSDFGLLELLTCCSPLNSSRGRAKEEEEESFQQTSNSQDSSILNPSNKLNQPFTTSQESPRGEGQATRLAASSLLPPQLPSTHPLPVSIKSPANPKVAGPPNLMRDEYKGTGHLIDASEGSFKSARGREIDGSHPSLANRLNKPRIASCFRFRCPPTRVGDATDNAHDSLKDGKRKQGMLMGGSSQVVVLLATPSSCLDGVGCVRFTTLVVVVGCPRLIGELEELWHLCGGQEEAGIFSCRQRLSGEKGSNNGEPTEAGGADIVGGGHKRDGPVEGGSDNKRAGGLNDISCCFKQPSHSVDRSLQAPIAGDGRPPLLFELPLEAPSDFKVTTSHGHHHQKQQQRLASSIEPPRAPEPVGRRRRQQSIVQTWLGGPRKPEEQASWAALSERPPPPPILGGRDKDIDYIHPAGRREIWKTSQANKVCAALIQRQIKATAPPPPPPPPESGAARLGSKSGGRGVGRELGPTLLGANFEGRQQMGRPNGGGGGGANGSHKSHGQAARLPERGLLSNGLAPLDGLWLLLGQSYCGGGGRLGGSGNVSRLIHDGRRLSLWGGPEEVSAADCSRDKRGRSRGATIRANWSTHLANQNRLARGARVTLTIAPRNRRTAAEAEAVEAEAEVLAAHKKQKALINHHQDHWRLTGKFSSPPLGLQHSKVLRPKRVASLSPEVAAQPALPSDVLETIPDKLPNKHKLMPREDDGGATIEESSSSGSGAGRSLASRRRSGCALFDDKPYVIYSALGSFYIPMLVMIFFYSRIYLVASRAQKALQRGYMTAKWPAGGSGRGGVTSAHGSSVGGSGYGGGGGNGSSSGCGGGYGDGGFGYGAEQVTLRIHRREKGLPIVLPDSTTTTTTTGTGTSTLVMEHSSLGLGGNSAESSTTQTTMDRPPNYNHNQNQNQKQQKLKFKQQRRAAEVAGRQSSSGDQVDCSGNGNGNGNGNINNNNNTTICESDNIKSRALLKLTAQEQRQQQQQRILQNSSSLASAFKTKVGAIDETKGSDGAGKQPEGSSDPTQNDRPLPLGTSTNNDDHLPEPCCELELPVVGGIGDAIAQGSGADIIQGQTLELLAGQGRLISADESGLPVATNELQATRCHSTTLAASSPPTCTNRKEEADPVDCDSGALAVGLHQQHRKHHRHHRHHHHHHHHRHHHHHHLDQNYHHHKHKHRHHHSHHSHHHSHHHNDHLSGHNHPSQNHHHHKPHKPNGVIEQASSLRRATRQPDEMLNRRDAGSGNLMKCDSIAEEGGSCQAPPGEPGGRPCSQESDDRSSISSVQITVSQFNGSDSDCEKLTKHVEPTPMEALKAGSEASTEADKVLPAGNSCDRSVSLAMDQGSIGGSSHNNDVVIVGQQTGGDNHTLMALNRVDRSQSCGPTPTILLNWNPETGSAEAQLSETKPRIASEQALATPEEPRSHSLGIGQHQGGGGGNGSQSSGLSIMASLPMAANHVRKQSMMLLSSLTTRSSQTLRRLSMVAAHPVDSLLSRSRSHSGESSSSNNDDNDGHESNDNSKHGDGDDTTSDLDGNGGRACRGGSRKGRRKRLKKRKKKKRRRLGSSRSAGAPKRTFDDYLMAVTGIDGSSDEDPEICGGQMEDDGDEDDDDDEDDDEEEEGEEDYDDENIIKSDSLKLNYSFLLGRDEFLVPSIQIVTGHNDNNSDLKAGENQSTCMAAGQVDRSNNSNADGQSSLLSEHDKEGKMSNQQNIIANTRDLPEETLAPEVEEEEEGQDQSTVKRPFTLHRQGACYERATSRASANEMSNHLVEISRPHTVVSVLKSTINGLKQQAATATAATNASTTNDPSTILTRIATSGGSGKLPAGGVNAPGATMAANKTTRPGGGRRRGAKRTSRWHAKRLHAETKAAKTVAIIIGGFIFCWLPFFTAYLSRAIICDRPDCVPQSLLSLFIWLGYLNSAINPVIYGLFSADFRQAFKNILCRCRFRNGTDDTVVVSVLVDSIIKSIL